MKIGGSIVAIVTPFRRDGEIDVSALREMVQWHVGEGTNAIVACGTTGEVSTLDDEERVKIYREIIEGAAGRVPVIAGVFSNCTRTAKRMAQEAKACGANAALVVVPYFNRPTYEGVKRHFEEVAEVGIPMIFYNHPSRTALKLTADELVELCENPMIFAIKEGSGELDIVQQFLRFSKKTLFSGDDVLALPQLAAGAQGIISIVANVIPRLWSDFAKAGIGNDIPKARAIYAKVAEVCHAMIVENNPQCVKYALSLMGKCEPVFRLPLVVPREKTRQIIQEALLKLQQKAYTPEETCTV